MLSGGLMPDHRSKRINKIKTSSVLDMGTASFKNQLNIIPSSRYDLYHRVLRQPNSIIKQTAAPADIDVRHVEINTDEILYNDKSVQYCYPSDDTKFFDLLNEVKFKKQSKKLNLTQYCFSRYKKHLVVG
jgi:hypothetical protein